MKSITASIITIGDELLIGQVIDTNSAFIARELNGIGIWVKRRVAVGDVWEDIWLALDEEARHADIVLLTGGLGPTADDITKPLLCEYFHTRLVENKEAAENVRRIFAGREMPHNVEGQKMVPENCLPIPNKRGTAYGMWFEKEGTLFISMPGVPHEMQGMVTDFLLPAFKNKFTLPFIYYRTLLTAGQGESAINFRIRDFEKALPPDIRLAYLPDLGKVRLRLTTSGENAEETRLLVDKEFRKMETILADIAISDNGDNMQEALGKLLVEKKLSVGTAESCTAGNIAHTISTVAGASRYLQGGIVSYSNAVKQAVLEVKPETLEQYGAVSEQTVREMVSGCRRRLQVDMAVAVSGILGPDGGTPDKPVGTVWIAAGDSEQTVTHCLHLRYNNRERNMVATTNAALNLLFHFVKNRR